MKVLGLNSLKQISTSLHLSESGNIIHICFKTSTINLVLAKSNLSNKSEFYFGLYSNNSNNNNNQVMFSSNYSIEYINEHFCRISDYAKITKDNLQDVIRFINKEIVENCFLLIYESTSKNCSTFSTISPSIKKPESIINNSNYDDNKFINKTLHLKFGLKNIEKSTNIINCFEINLNLWLDSSVNISNKIDNIDLCKSILCTDKTDDFINENTDKTNIVKEVNYYKKDYNPLSNVQNINQSIFKYKFYKNINVLSIFILIMLLIISYIFYQSNSIFKIQTHKKEYSNSLIYLKDEDNSNLNKYFFIENLEMKHSFNVNDDNSEYGNSKVYFVNNSMFIIQKKLSVDIRDVETNNIIKSTNKFLDNNNSISFLCYIKKDISNIGKSILTQFDIILIITENMDIYYWIVDLTSKNSFYDVIDLSNIKFNSKITCMTEMPNSYIVIGTENGELYNLKLELYENNNVKKLLITKYMLISGLDIIVYIKKLSNDLFLIVNKNSFVKVYEYSVNKILLVNKFKHNDIVFTATILNNNLIALATESGYTYIWNIETNKKLNYFKKMYKKVTSIIQLSKYLVATSTEDGNLIIWDLKTCKFELFKSLKNFKEENVKINNIVKFKSNIIIAALNNGNILKFYN